MYKCTGYVFPESMEEAYKLNQKKSNKIIAGGGWLKLGSRQYATLIDLSRLGLDEIYEDEECFKIGAMVSLRQLETHEGLNLYTQGAIKESLKHIVGVQFRNSATIGGSIYGRFGFSDVLTMLMALDGFAGLYKGGSVPLEDFAKMKYDRDILSAVTIRKQKNIKTVYSSFRNQSTDFPVLACAMSLSEGKIRTALGARPARAEVITAELPTDIDRFANETANSFAYGGNMRASAEYRRHIAYVLIKRNAEILAGGKAYGD